MFGKKKFIDFEEKIKEAKYERIYQTLQDILKMEIKAYKDGKDKTDFAATCSAIKTKARLAVDFVTDLSKGGDDKK